MEIIKCPGTTQQMISEISLIKEGYMFSHWIPVLPGEGTNGQRCMVYMKPESFFNTQCRPKKILPDGSVFYHTQ